MTVPTHADVQEMDRILKIMNGERPAKPINGTGPNVTTTNDGVEVDVGAMAKIMESYSSATGVKSFTDKNDIGGINGIAHSLASEAHSNKPLREALVTKKTDQGVSIGAWEIRKVMVEGFGEKNEVRYKVKNVNTGQNIKVSFLVLESAKTVVELMNNGASLSHSKIREIAKLEIDYRRQRKQALEEKYFWRKAKKENDEFKLDLYEAKFDAAQARALYTKEKIKNIYMAVRKGL